MRPRAVYWEEDAARAVVDRLHECGYDADVARDRLAGEDDDEDHPWMVLTEAPTTLLAELVEAHDGWLDEESPDAPPPRPLALPDAPRRVRGDFRDP